jgi:hypothetical protein
MGRKSSRHTVTYVVATLAALGCLYGCSDAQYGAGGEPHHEANAHHPAATTSGRPAADTARFDPGAFRAVVVSSAGEPGRATVVTSASVLTTIEGLLNRLPAAAPADRSCPATVATYQLTLEPAEPGQPVVVLRTGGCRVDDLVIGGRTQPARSDPADSLYQLARSLLRRVLTIGWPLPRLQHCHNPETPLTRQSTPCPGGPPAPGHRIPQ